MTNHARELTYPAVVRLLEDGKWHTAEEFETVTCFPSEWLKEVEREHTLERRADAPGVVRLHRARRVPQATQIRTAVLLGTLPIALLVGSITGSTDAVLAVLAVGVLASVALLFPLQR